MPYVQTIKDMVRWLGWGNVFGMYLLVYPTAVGLALFGLHHASSTIDNLLFDEFSWKRVRYLLIHITCVFTACKFATSLTQLQLKCP